MPWCLEVGWVDLLGRSNGPVVGSTGMMMAAAVAVRGTSCQRERLVGLVAGDRRFRPSRFADAIRPKCATVFPIVFTTVSPSVRVS